MRYLIIILTFCSCSVKKAPTKSYDFDLPMFNKQVTNQIRIKALTRKDDAIEDIKLYNTILFYNLKKDSLHRFYIEYFEKNIRQITSVLRCGSGLGMTTVCEDSLNIGSYYSRKSIYTLNIEPPNDGRETILQNDP